MPMGSLRFCVEWGMTATCYSVSVTIAFLYDIGAEWRQVIHDQWGQSH